MKFNKKILIFIAVLIVSIAVAYYIGRSVGVAERFTNEGEGGNMTYNNPSFKLKPKNVSFFMNMSESEAATYGVSSETFATMQNIFKNNSSPVELGKYLETHPDQGEALKKLVLNNSGFE